MFLGLFFTCNVSNDRYVIKKCVIIKINKYIIRAYLFLDFLNT